MSVSCSFFKKSLHVLRVGIKVGVGVGTSVGPLVGDTDGFCVGDVVGSVAADMQFFSKNLFQIFGASAVCIGHHGTETD